MLSVGVKMPSWERLTEEFLRLVATDPFGDTGKTKARLVGVQVSWERLVEASFLVAKIPSGETGEAEARATTASGDYAQKSGQDTVSSCRYQEEIRSTSRERKIR